MHMYGLRPHIHRPEELRLWLWGGFRYGNRNMMLTWLCGSASQRLFELEHNRQEQPENGNDGQTMLALQAVHDRGATQVFRVSGQGAGSGCRVAQASV